MASVVLRTDAKSSTKNLENKSFGVKYDFWLTPLASILCKIEVKGVYDTGSLNNQGHNIPSESEQYENFFCWCKVKNLW